MGPDAMAVDAANILLSVGVVLSAAILGGLSAQRFHLPQVTAYLLVGMLLGPHMLSVIPERDLEHLEPVGKLAMSLVLLNLGCHFTPDHVRRVARRLPQLTLGDAGATFLLVTLGLKLLGQPWAACLLFGSLSVATAPATTTLVMKEVRSEGPVTEYALAMVALNNLLAIVLFEVLLGAIRVNQGVSHAESLLFELRRIAADLGGSLALGILAGVATGYLCGLWPQSRWLLLLFAVTTLALGICTHMQIPYLLTFLAMGLTVARTSDHTGAIVKELDRTTDLLCVVFFVIHGAHLDLGALRAAGILGIGYIVLRLIGKWGGSYLAADPHVDGPQVRRWLGGALLSQAGTAIALSAVAASSQSGLGETGRTIQTVILGTVVFFEIAGPILLRYAVLQAGEVPLDQVIHHTTTTPWEEFRALWNRTQSSLGLNPWRARTAEDITVGELMRRGVRTIPAAASFEEVVNFMEQSHDNTFPVVDEEGSLVGIIRYNDLRDALFDPELGSLVCAADLAISTPWHLSHDAPLSEAIEILRVGDDDCVPVATAQAPYRFAGVVRRRDLFRYVFQGSKGAEADSSELG
jgi:Kef-type K+ transport system membrane component KefB/predicted transcriptional regulator